MERMAIEVPFIKLDPSAIIPSFGGGDDTNAGLDLYALYGVTIPPGGSAIVSTGVAWDGMALMTTYEKPMFKIFSRSGMAFNQDVEASNAGVGDASYQGALKVKLRNHGAYAVTIAKGERIAQGVVEMIPNVKPVEATGFSTVTARGDKGFGSTGS